MATAANLTLVQQAYVSFFGRPADQGGLNFWADAIESGAETLESLFANFEQSAEGQQFIGQDNATVINDVYTNVLGRAYDAAADGTFWLDALTSGAETKASVTLAILQGAVTGDDAKAVANKVAAADQMTAAAGDSFDDVKDALETQIAAVTSDDSTVATAVAAAQAAIDAAGIDPGTPGTTFTLTDARDTKTGTDDNDSFYGDVGQNGNGASANAFSTGDTIDGGNGTDKLFATLINDNEVDGADADLSINARTENLEEVYLSVLDENVIVDGGRMDAVDEFWSDDSDASLVLEDVRLGTGQSITKDITFGMKDVDQQSGLSAAFDTQSLTKAGPTTSNSQLLVRIADVSTATPDTPLANVNLNLSFTLGTATVSLEDVRSTDGTYAGLVAAIDAALTAKGYESVDVTLSTPYTQVTVGQNTSVLDFTAHEVLLTDPNGNAFSSVNFTQSAIQPVAGSFLVAGNATPLDPSTSSAVIETNLILDNAGRGSTAGDAVIGGMSNSGQAIDKLNLTVNRDSKIDDLATATGMENNAFNTATYDGFKEIEITSISNNGLLSVNDIQDTTTVNANAFAGASLTINKADALQTLNASINGDVTVTANTAAGNNVYTTGGGKDTLTVEVSGNDVDTAGEGFTANTAGGNDTVTITMDAGVSQDTMVALDNLNINTAAGADSVNLNAYGNFDINTGNDSDFVRINSTDANGNATTGSWTIGDTSQSATNFFDERVLYNAKLTISLGGIENTVDVETDAAGNFVATQADINAAIKAAIDASPELSVLLNYADSTGNQALSITSTVGGLNNLGIAIYQPQLESTSAGVTTGANEGENVLVASADIAALRQGLISTGVETNSDNLETAAEIVAVTDGAGNWWGSVAADGTADQSLTSTYEIEGDVVSGANVADTTDGIFQDSLASLYFAQGSGTSGTNATTGVNLSSINAGSGSNDVVVMHSDALASNKLIIDQTFGKVTVVNWHNAASEGVTAVTAMGEHALDFSAYLSNQQDTSTSLSGNNDSATAIASTVNLVSGASSFGAAVSVGVANTNTAVANSVNVIRFTQNLTDNETFANLTTTSLIAALNDTANDGSQDYGNLTQATLNPTVNANLVGTTQNHIIMVENGLNEGEYKVFSVTSTLNAGKTATATTGTGANNLFDTNAVELGTLDFGASINFNLVGSTAYTSFQQNLIDAIDSGAANFTYDADGNGTVGAGEGQTDTPALDTGSSTGATVGNTVVSTATNFNTEYGVSTSNGTTTSVNDDTIVLGGAHSGIINGLAGTDTLKSAVGGSVDLTDSTISNVENIDATGITTLTAFGAQLNGVTISNIGSNSVVAELSATDADLSGYTLSGVTGVDLAGQTATLTAAQTALSFTDSADSDTTSNNDINIIDTGAAIAALDLATLASTFGTVTVDASDNAVTLTQANAAAATLTAGDAVTVTGVTAANIVATSALVEAGDTLQVDDSETVILTVAQLNALTSSVVADAAAGTDATVSVTAANSDTITAATGLVDTFDFGSLTAGQSASIDGTVLATGDMIDLGVVINAFTDGTDVGAQEITATFAAGDTTFAVETHIDGTSTADYTVTVTGVDLSSATVAAGIITIV